MRLFSMPSNPIGLVVAGTAALLIAVLAGAGPFFNPIRSTAQQPVELAFVPGDRQLATSVGALDTDAHAFKTTQASGVLVYGPYITLWPGSYAVSWTGTVRTAGAPRFEVFSGQGGVIAASQVPLPVSAGSVELRRIEFEVKKALPDVELRVLVDQGDDLSIERVTLQATPHPGKTQ